MSLFVYADIGPRPPPGHRRQVVTIAPTAVPAGNLPRRRREMDDLLPHLERLATGISDDGWQHLSRDLITSIHSFPLEWTAVMRRMALACEQVRRAT